MEVALWICVGTVLYVYLGYPCLLMAMAGIRRSRSEPPDEGYEPSVTIIVSAFNEEKVIAEKLANAIALDYPSEKISIAVVSDNSTDATDSIVKRYSSERVRLVRMNRRVGKSIGLNAAMESVTSDIVLFTDANAMFDRNALKLLARHFADPHVGCVTGAQCYFPSSEPAGKDEGVYWRYELFVKRLESRTGSLVGGDGAIMAIRKNLYHTLEAADLSDFILPLRIVAAGYRNVFEPQAKCYEHTASSYDKEFARKVRIVNRAWRATVKMRQLLNPFAHGWFSVQLASHKLLRWLLAPVMAIALVANVFVADEAPIYMVMLAGQLLFYAAAICGYAMTRRDKSPPSIVSAAYYLCLVNAAGALGIIESLGGKEYTIWSTVREGESA